MTKLKALDLVNGNILVFKALQRNVKGFLNMNLCASTVFMSKSFKIQNVFKVCTICDMYIQFKGNETTLNFSYYIHLLH